MHGFVSEPPFSQAVWPNGLMKCLIELWIWINDDKMIRKRWWPTQLGSNLSGLKQSFHLIIFNVNIQKPSFHILCPRQFSLIICVKFMTARLPLIQSSPHEPFLCFEFKSHHVLITKPPIFQRWGGFLQLLITFVGRYWMIFIDQKWRTWSTKVIKSNDIDI
jgi:hypothetical protein